MKHTKELIILAVFPLLYLFSCGTSGGGDPDGSVKINYNEYRQEIDGFGGSNAWTSVPRDIEAAQELINLLFSRTKGIGLTILRNRIPFRERLEGDDSPGVNDGFVTRKSDNTYDYTVNRDGTKTFNLNWGNWDLAYTRNLIGNILDLGNDGPENLIIMSTPWTPPNNRVTQWKEDITGVSPRLDYKIDWSKPDIWGRLKRDKYEDYADLLADYALNFETKMGAPLAVLSIQNEPNYKVDYESAYWNGANLRDFLNIAAQRFQKKGVTLGKGGLGIMMPEYENFNINYNDMIKPSIDSPASNSIITHIGLHQYNGIYDSTDKAGAKAFPDIIAAGKRFWQTEVSGSGGQLPSGTGIDNAIFYARMIHQDFTFSEVNAYLYWWLWRNGDKDKNFPGGLINIEDGETIITSKRLYALGQFSRFIRPGWFRIESDTSVKFGVYSSAYRNPKTNEIAIVLINDRGAANTLSLDLSGAEFSEISAWRTSANEELKNLGKQKASRNTLNIKLPPKSITTLYGRVK
jgi:O-glycosyl hydrolase